MTEPTPYNGPTDPHRARRRKGAVATEPPAPLTAPGRALALTRLSTAVETNYGNNDDQYARLERDAASNGWVIEYHHSERGTSAFDKDEPWPGYIEAWELVAEGQIDAVLAVEADRFTRDTVEMALFLRHCAAHGMRRICLAGRVFDPASPDDEMTTTILGAVAQRESAIKRHRAVRKNQANAKAGKPTNGRRPYGYEKGGLEIREDEALVIKELMARALAGAPILHLARDLNGRGIPTAEGNKWTASGIKNLLWAWRIAGIRSRYDVPVKENAWPAIVSRADVEAFRNIRIRPYRKRGRPGAMLTGLLVCECHGFPVRVQNDYYTAGTNTGDVKCSISVRKEYVEEWVTREFLRRINSGEHLTAGNDLNAKELGNVQKQLTEVRRRIEVNASKYAEGRISDEAYETADERLRERHDSLLSRQLELTVMPAAKALEGVDDRWDQLSTTEQRKLLQILIEKVEFRRRPPGSRAERRFDGVRDGRIVWRKL